MNPKLAHVTVEEMLRELLRRRGGIVATLDAAVAAATGAPHARSGSAKAGIEPGVAAKTPASKATAATAKRGRKPGAKAVVSATTRTTGGRTRPPEGGRTEDFVLSALGASGEAMSPSEVAGAISNMGWRTSSDKPGTIVGLALLKLAKDKKVRIQARGRYIAI